MGPRADQHLYEELVVSWWHAEKKSAKAHMPRDHTTVGQPSCIWISVPWRTRKFHHLAAQRPNSRSCHIAAERRPNSTVYLSNTYGDTAFYKFTCSRAQKVLCHTVCSRVPKLHHIRIHLYHMQFCQRQLYSEMSSTGSRTVQHEQGDGIHINSHAVRPNTVYTRIRQEGTQKVPFQPCSSTVASKPPCNSHAALSSQCHIHSHVVQTNQEYQHACIRRPSGTKAHVRSRFHAVQPNR